MFRPGRCLELFVTIFVLSGVCLICNIVQVEDLGGIHLNARIQASPAEHWGGLCKCVLNCNTKHTMADVESIDQQV